MDTDALVFIQKRGSSTFDANPAEVDTCARGTHRCDVVFKRSLRRYSFANENVAICKKRTVYEASECMMFEVRDGERQALRGALRAALYKSDNPKFEDRFVVRFARGTTRIYAQSELAVVSYPNRPQCRSVARYLQRVAEVLATCDPTGDPAKDEHLVRQFRWIDAQVIYDTAVRCMADPSTDANKTEPWPFPIIYPFGTNLSQMDAVDNALSHTLSIIEGPPGTGKTQTILNIAANLVSRNKSVLVVSPNNEATKNVVDKLVGAGFGHVVAPLGNKDNRVLFVAQQSGYPEDFDGWRLSKSAPAFLESLIKRRAADARRLLAEQRELAQAKDSLREWELEQRAFVGRFPRVSELRCPKGTDDERLHELREMIARDAEQHGRIRFFTRLRCRFSLGIGLWSDYACAPIDFELRVNAMLLERRTKALRERVEAMETDIAALGSQDLLGAIRDSSVKVLKGLLYEHYCAGGDRPRERPRFSLDDLWHFPQKLRREYPVITSTTNSARKQLGKDYAPFDWVIIDESSQANLVTGFLALSCARHAVVVGDTKQLPCVITREASEASERVFAEAGVGERYRYASESLLSCLERCVGETGLSAPITLLREHYRCSPQIIGFCNQQFYDGKLIVMTEDESAGDALRVLLTKDENYDRAADYNHVQAELVVEEAIPRLREHFAVEEIGIVSPYRHQVEGMQQRRWGLSPIEIDTVHKYQGREKDAMVFVTRANSLNDFMDNPNLVNVAISRAKQSFTLVASPRILEGRGNLADFARYVRRNSGDVVQTSTCSAFDLIYPTRTAERERYLRERGAAGDQYSEVSFALLLEKALGEADADGRFGLLRNYPLRLFVSDGAELSARERGFVNSSAHADFLVFRKIDREVVYEIEVNGSQHAKERQAGRDELKRGILDKLGVPHDAVLTNEAEHELSRHVASIVRAIRSGDTGNRNGVRVRLKEDEE